MAVETVLWAGKRLTPDEERETRRVVAQLREAGRLDAAEQFERFLPERVEGWTPDDLEAGAHMGPWMGMGAERGPLERD